MERDPKPNPDKIAKERAEELESPQLRQMLAQKFEREYKVFFKPGNAEERNKLGMRVLLAIDFAPKRLTPLISWDLDGKIRNIPYSGLEDLLEKVYGADRDNSFRPIKAQREHKFELPSEQQINLTQSQKQQLGKDISVLNTSFPLFSDGDIGRVVQRWNFKDPRGNYHGEIWIGKKWKSMPSSPRNEIKTLVKVDQ